MQKTLTHSGVEITYDEAAEILAISPRATRDVLKTYATVCPCIRYSSQKKRFDLSQVLTVKKLRRAAALKAATKGKSR